MSDLDREERKWANEGKPKRRLKGAKGKGKEKSVMFACLEEEENGPEDLEIPENGVNTAYRHINMGNSLGGNDLGMENLEKECSSIIDT